MSQIEDLKSPVNRAVLFVCEKCGKHVSKSTGEEQNAAKTFQKAVKRESKRLGDKHAVRVVLTGCLNVYPDDELTVAIASVDKPTRFILVSPSADFEEAASELIRQITQPSLKK